MVKKFTYPNHVDEQGSPKVQYIHVQSSVGEDKRIEFNRWAILIRYQLTAIARKLHKLEKQSNINLFKR